MDKLLSALGSFDLLGTVGVAAEAMAHHGAADPVLTGLLPPCPRHCQRLGSRCFLPKGGGVRKLFQEILSLFFTVIHQLSYKSRGAIQLRFGTKLTKHRDSPHFDDPPLGTREVSFLDPLVDFFYEEYFLV